MKLQTRVRNHLPFGKYRYRVLFDTYGTAILFKGKMIYNDDNKSKKSNKSRCKILKSKYVSASLHSKVKRNERVLRHIVGIRRLSTININAMLKKIRRLSIGKVFIDFKPLRTEQLRIYFTSREDLLILNMIYCDDIEYATKYITKYEKEIGNTEDFDMKMVDSHDPKFIWEVDTENESKRFSNYDEAKRFSIENSGTLYQLLKQ